MIADRFSRIFQKEHERARDGLVELGDAFAAGDCERAASLLRLIGRLVGPHFRYEEEALFPALVSILGAEAVERLLAEHDRAIGAAERLVALASSSPFGDEETGAALRLVRGIVEELRDCEALSSVAEQLPEATLESILARRDQVLRADVGLVEWATWLRERPLVAPA